MKNKTSEFFSNDHAKASLVLLAVLAYFVGVWATDGVLLIVTIVVAGLVAVYLVALDIIRGEDL